MSVMDRPQIEQTPSRNEFSFLRWNNFSLQHHNLLWGSKFCSRKTWFSQKNHCCGTAAGGSPEAFVRI
ncbi:MAG: hypothetical protein GXY42_08940 [Desulfovibrionales bacterium]|nr:hypothetical protein [Desulfovibrionales bacterium]